MQTTAPGDDDLEVLIGFRPWKRAESRRCFSLRIVLQGVGVVAVLALLSSVIALSVRLRSIEGNSWIAPECIHALGGGPIGPGGSLRPVTPEHCKQQLKSYAQHAYWVEVELAARDAMETFGFKPENMHSSQAAQHTVGDSSSWQWPALPLHLSWRRLLSFPEAHTQRIADSRTKAHTNSRSRLGGPTSQGAANSASPTLAPKPASTTAATNQSRRRLVVFDIDETILSNMPQILDPETWPWEAWVEAAQAEPLQPLQQFYHALCKNGYAIALVTGRRETSRNSTVANLKRAGYGKQCLQSSTQPTCCYDALYMRTANDTRLASVYKPWARKQLLATGQYELVALLGDQFSDINGEGVEAGVQAYKLPNPFYFIL